MAASLMSGRIKGNTLQPTALVHEAYLRLLLGESRWDSKALTGRSLATAKREWTYARAWLYDY